MESLKEKTKFLKAKSLGGAMFWSLDTDDFNGEFCNQVGLFNKLILKLVFWSNKIHNIISKGRYPLINSVKSSLLALGLPIQNPTQVPSTKKKPTVISVITKGSTTASNKNKPVDEGEPEDQLSDFKCPSNGNFPNLSNGCKSYFQCEHVGISKAKMGFEHQCPPGLLFNKKKEICDWPSNVKCV